MYFVKTKIVTYMFVYVFKRINMEKKKKKKRSKLYQFWKQIKVTGTRHYQNTPIQIYRKFHPQKFENFQVKKLWYF